MDQELINALNAGAVELHFTSMTSGREVVDLYTLQGVNVPNNDQSDRIVLLHIATALYEDVLKDSITSWQAIDG